MVHLSCCQQDRCLPERRTPFLPPDHSGRSPNASSMQQPASAQRTLPKTLSQLGLKALLCRQTWKAMHLQQGLHSITSACALHDLASRATPVVWEGGHCSWTSPSAESLKDSTNTLPLLGTYPLGSWTAPMHPTWHACAPQSMHKGRLAASKCRRAGKAAIRGLMSESSLTEGVLLKMTVPACIRVLSARRQDVMAHQPRAL